MQKINICKLLAIGIIILFISVGIYPAFAVDIKQTIDNKTSEDDCGCNEVNDRQLVVLEKQLNRLEVYSKLLLVLSRDSPEGKEKCKEILDIINSEGFWELFCNYLAELYNKCVELTEYYYQQGRAIALYLVTMIGIGVYSIWFVLC